MFYFHIHINISNQLQNYEEYTENFVTDLKYLYVPVYENKTFMLFFIVSLYILIYKFCSGALEITWGPLTYRNFSHGPLISKFCKC